MPAIYGGVEEHVHQLSVGLVRHGHEVTAYARSWYTGGKHDPIHGVHIELIPTLKTKHFDALVHTFLSTIHAMWKGFDVIHYHSVGPSLLSWIPRVFAPKTRVIVTFHSIDRYHQKWNWFARLTLKMGEWAACHFAHETITISRSLKQYCMNEYVKETTFIPYGIGIEHGEISEQPLAQYGLEKNKYLVMVSRLVPHKGAHLLIEAFSRLKKKYADDPSIKALKLAIVGGAVYTDDYVSELHSLASHVNDVVFTGFLSGEPLKALYAHATALVHPSLNEGLPMTVLSAMSFGKPAIVSNIPEHLELVSDTRAIFQENDVDALEAKLIEFLQLSDSAIADLGEQNLRTVQTVYNWDALVPQVAAVYAKTTQNAILRESEI